MNKAELIIDMESRLDGTALVQVLIESDPHFNHYYAVIKIIKNLVAEVQSVQYFVFNEGTGSEEAYYRIELPLPTIDESLSTTSFRDTVEAGIATRITAGIIEKATITEIDEEQERAIISVYILDTGTLYNRLYLIWNDKDSTIQFEQI